MVLILRGYVFIEKQSRQSKEDVEVAIAVFLTLIFQYMLS
jgi:hypothetical protein